MFKAGLANNSSYGHGDDEVGDGLCGRRSWCRRPDRKERAPADRGFRLRPLGSFTMLAVRAVDGEKQHNPQACVPVNSVVVTV
jgi:hypothetical protein